MKGLLARTGLAVVVVATLGTSGAPAIAQTSGQPIRLSAFAVNMSNIATGATGVIDIRINQWSTDKEREDLIAAFLDKGQDGLLKALQKVPVKGRISNPGRRGADPAQTRLGWDLRFAMQWAGEDGGTRILAATDRYMTFQEVRNQPRTVDYPFTFIEIHLNKEGEGEGKLAVATQLKFDKKQNTIVFENYSTEPVRLNQVKVVK
jgi:hypothetical protein